jgi:NADH-quinone oxidoreductase subunit K
MFELTQYLNGIGIGSDLTEMLLSGGLIELGLEMFCLALLGIVFPLSNVIVLFMSIELMLISINLVFIGIDVVWDDVMGQVFALFILTVAAAESAIGLAILISFSQSRGGLDMEKSDIMILRN